MEDEQNKDGISIYINTKSYDKLSDPTNPRYDTSVEVYFRGDITQESIDRIFERTASLMADLNTAHNSLEESVDDGSSSDTDEEQDMSLDGESKTDQNMPETVTQEDDDIVEEDQDTVRRAWDNYGSVIVEGQSDDYHVVFPKVNQEVALPPLETTDFERKDDDRSYPVCSCKAYHYMNYEKDTPREGSCKHIQACMKAINPGYTIKWANRPRCLPLSLRNQGYVKYEWVPPI